MLSVAFRIFSICHSVWILIENYLIIPENLRTCDDFLIHNETLYSIFIGRESVGKIRFEEKCPEKP